MSADTLRRHPGEAHSGSMAPRLNWLRAGVLGANDGIVSTVGLVAGVAGATSARGAIFTAQLALERLEFEESPELELVELTDSYRTKGLSNNTALLVATELTAQDARHDTTARDGPRRYPSTFNPRLITRQKRGQGRQR